MDEAQPESLTKKELVHDLEASLRARRELGYEVEEQVLEAFLARVQQRIEAQVAEQLARSGDQPPAGQRKGNMPGWMWPTSLLVSFPMVAAAANYAGALGVLVVMVALLVLTRFWLDYGKRA